MTDLTATSCRLNWKEPDDDGGKPITGYVIEKMDKATGKWIPVAHTEPDKTNTLIRGLQDGHEYMFRVKAINDEGESEPLETEAAIKAKNPYGIRVDKIRNIACKAVRIKIYANISYDELHITHFKTNYKRIHFVFFPNIKTS